MTPNFAQAVDPIFLYVLALLDRISRDTKPKPQEERARIRALIDEAEARLGSGTEWELAKYALVSWIDEMYDIAARLPHKAGFRLTQVTAVPLPKRTGKDKYVARLTLHGVMASDQDTLVSQFLEEIHKDPHLRAAPADFRGQEFTLKIDVTAQPPKKYQTRFTPPPPAKTPVAEPEMPPEDDS